MNFSLSSVSALTLCLIGGCSGSGSQDGPTVPMPPAITPTPPAVTPTPGPTSSVGAGRGFPILAPWASSYGAASELGDLSRAAQTFRILNIDADPDVGNFTPAQITRLKAGGANRVISYLNAGSMENFRSYWTRAPGFVAGRANKAAHLGKYDGYPDEMWMDLGNADYQNLIVNYVAPRLVAQGADGFFLDNLELVEHGPRDKNGPCSAGCRQGGLHVVRRLREKYPNLLIVMQNATGDVTRLGTTGGLEFPSLLDGISHEEVYAPTYDADSEAELQKWRALNLTPGGRAFWIATEDYVGSCSNVSGARAAYARSRAQGFSPYATDQSARQQSLCYWPF